MSGWELFGPAPEQIADPSARCRFRDCVRKRSHEGDHADVSLSGLVLNMWPEPALTDEQIEVIERIAQVREDLIGALDDAMFELRHIADEKVVVEDVGLRVVVSEAQRCMYNDAESMGFSEDRGDWGTELEAIRRRESERLSKRRAS